jgi:hypothetical protein
MIMAYCKIKSIKLYSRGAGVVVGKTANYVKNRDKTANPITMSKSINDIRNEEIDVLDRTAAYVRNADKTEKEYFVTGIKCNPATITEDFMMVKSMYNDVDREISHYHCIQSFSAYDPITPEQCHKIGIETAKKLTGGNFQVLVTTHLNTDKLHNHIVINGVGLDGRHFPNNKAKVREFRAISDDFCRQYGLDVMANGRNRKIPKGSSKDETKIRSKRNLLAKKVIDDVIKEATSLDDFIGLMAEQGYYLNCDMNHKYWTIRRKEWERSMRLYRLGNDYTNSALLERIERENGESDRMRYNRLRKENKFKIIYVDRKIYKKGRKLGRLQAMYLRYCYKLGVLPKKRPITITMVDADLKEDLLYADKISAETEYLFTAKIRDYKDLTEDIHATETEIKNLSTERSSLYSKKKYAAPEEQQLIINQIEEINGRIKELRNNLAVANRVKERSIKIADKLKPKENTDLGKATLPDAKEVQDADEIEVEKN